MITKNMNCGSAYFEMKPKTRTIVVLIFILASSFPPLPKNDANTPVCFFPIISALIFK